MNTNHVFLAISSIIKTTSNVGNITNKTNKTYFDRRKQLIGIFIWSDQMGKAENSKTKQSYVYRITTHKK